MSADVETRVSLDADEAAAVADAPAVSSVDAAPDEVPSPVGSLEKTSGESIEFGDDAERAQQGEPEEKEPPRTLGIYELDESRWEKMLYGCDESQVMQLKPLDMRWHFDPLTWKFRTETEHAWTVPTGNRTPNRAALKALHKKMREAEEPASRRHRHQQREQQREHHHHHHRHHKGDDATKKEKKARKKGIKSTENPVSTQLVQVENQMPGSSEQSGPSHVNWSVPNPDKTVYSGGGSRTEEPKKEKRDKKLKAKKQSGRSYEIDLSQVGSKTTTGPPQPPPLILIEVTFFSADLHWYDLMVVADEDLKEGQMDEGEKAEKDSTGQANVPEDENAKNEAKDAQKDDVTTKTDVKTITLIEAERRASLEAKKLGDSRLVYILECRENDTTKEWRPISVGYGRHYLDETLRSRTTYFYRVRALDRERGLYSPWSEVLEVTTNRPPHTLQDLLLKIAANDLAGIAEILESGEVNPNAEDPLGFSPLMRAAQQNKIKLMQALMRNGASADFQSKHQRRTALMVAAYSGRMEAVKCLRLFEASYDLYDSSRLSAVHWAVDSGNMDLMEYMLADGANIECMDNQGWTPLHRTALVGSRTEGVCEVLLRYGAKIDRLDKDMKTPLMNATISNKGQIAQILISRGADVFIQNKDGRTAYDLACALERKGTMMLLEDLAKAQKKEVSTLHGHGLKGGPAKMDGTEFANLDSIARQLAQKMRKKPSIDPLA